jgi:3-isopropylmalate/(R)-2-methylmalate dehydratase large subunit
VRIEGKLSPGVGAKDVILALLARIGIGGGTGSVFEYTGPVVRSFSMEERMTLCNMSIEGGARAGMIAPDDTTYAYLAGREFAPAAFDGAVKKWGTYRTDDGARYDTTITLDVTDLGPMVTFGTNPGMGAQITAAVPDPSAIGDASQRASLQKALEYMGLRPGSRLSGHPIDVVFIGSCTNARINDLRQAAMVMRGKKVAPGVRALVVPGSYAVKRQAEAEGLDRVFVEAGAEWREPGCSMCIAMNGDEVPAGKYAVSTSNRNFEGRQGKGSRTVLSSPVTAAASAVTGRLTDVRSML